MGRFLRILQIVCFSLAGILALELLLRIGGGIILPEKKRPDLTENDQKKFRILALGESTTDSRNIMDGKAWPEQLEEQLRLKGLDVRVYNLGKIGVDSTLIASAIEEELDYYRPQLVISMMGINDVGHLRFDYVRTQSRILRFLALAFERISTRKACNFFSVSPSEKLPFTPEDLKIWMKSDQIEAKIREKVKDNKYVSQAMAMVADRIKSRELFLRAYEIYPLNESAIIGYLILSTNQNDPRCEIVADKIKTCSEDLSDQVLFPMALCYRMTGHENEIPVLKRRGISIVQGNQSELGKNYHYLYGVLSERKIPLVAMQYPTLSIESLKAQFLPAANYPGITFVSNEENFKQALVEKKYEDVFRDRFRETWGHTTSYGHSLIAQKLVPIVEEKIRRSDEAQTQSGRP